MTRRTYLAIVLLFSIAFATEVLPALGQDVSSEEASRLILNVYLDGTGKALVTGYVENIEGLPFLNSSQYNYENETGQLYALTNALTRKDGDIWTLNFESSGYYEDYRVTFYLPSDFLVKNISSSQGLEHLLSASNDSLALDFQGYDVLDPTASIEYQQPLEAGAPPNPRARILFQSSYLLPILLILIVGAASFFLWRYKSKSRRPQGSVQSVADMETSRPEKLKTTGGNSSEAIETALPSGVSPKGEEILKERAAEAEVPGVPEESTVPQEQASPQKGDISSEPQEPEEPDYMEEEEARAREDEKAKEEESAGEEARIDEDIGADVAAGVDADIQLQSAPSERIEISSEMAAVMETLTPRERAILQALIDRGGRSTQADLRYETRTPKSSLTGIIYSLERRKLVTKKEWGRTNVIELSEWFLSKKERS